MIDRRVVLIGSAAVLATPFFVIAQPRVHRVGVLSVGAPEDPADVKIMAAARKGLREVGWIEGENVRFEHRYARGNFELLPQLAADLVRLDVNVMLVGPGMVALVARRAASTIPIVFAASIDPLGAGFVAILARPGGNITGVSVFAGSEVAGKALELVRAVAPNEFIPGTWVTLLGRTGRRSAPAGTSRRRSSPGRTA